MSKLRLPRLQFSLRTLVIVMVIFAALASWHGARYARHQARVAALEEGVKRGLVFLPRESANLDYGKPVSGPATLSLAERWERFCFGDEVGKKFPYVKLDLGSNATKRNANDKTYYYEILQHFPELEIVDVRLPNVNDSQGIVWMIDGTPGQDAAVVAAAICDLASNPNIYQFYNAKPAMVGDAWVAALPPGYSLTHVKCPMCLSPKGTLELLSKAPALKEFWLNFTGKNKQVEKAIEGRFSITIKDGQCYLVRAKP